MTDQEAVSIVSEFIRRQDKAQGNGFCMPDGFDKALRIVLALAWCYQEIRS